MMTLSLATYVVALNCTLSSRVYLLLPLEPPPVNVSRNCVLAWFSMAAMLLRSKVAVLQLVVGVNVPSVVQDVPPLVL